MDSEDDLRGLVGLQNLGNTCYINAALQALSNCQQLTRFMLDCPGLVKDSGLSRCYSDLINEIWNPQNSQHAVPTSIIRNIKCIYPAFRGCTQQDTQEFLRCFLEQLHDELKQPLASEAPQPKPQSLQQPVASTSKAQDPASEETTATDSDTSNHSSDSQPQQPEQQPPPPPPPKQQPQQQPRSIISDTFEFRISSSIVCSSCNNISTTKEIFKDLSVPIPSRDHPYYQQQQQAQSDNISEQPAAKSNSLNSSTTSTSSLNGECDKVTPSKRSSKGAMTKGTKTKDDEMDSSKSDSDDKCDDDGGGGDGKEEEEEEEGEGEEADSNSDDTDKLTGKEVQTTSYLDAIPLAKWFLNWFSQLGSWFWGPQVTLHDCLSVFFGTDPLEGENEYSCEVCTKKNRGVKYLKILDLPEVLCIHFKRYESVGSAKITTHVSFPLTGLDLAPFMCSSSEAQCTTYNLIACICHHGSALLTGHYTTYALNCYDDQWYEFDDQYVTCVSNYQVENSEAYILFYQKSTSDDTSSSFCKGTRDEEKNEQE